MVTNLARPEERAQDHACTGAWLTGVAPKRTDGADFLAGKSIDQIVAEQIGKETTFPSLEVATEDFTAMQGACIPGFSCAYMNTLSWTTPTTPLPMETNPRAVFERMFGWENTREQRLARMKSDHSVLDLINEDLADLQKGLGDRDRARVGEYVDYVREIERRIQRSEKQTEKLLTVPSAPVGIPEVVRRSRRHAVRPAGAGLRGGSHARLHVHDEPRVQPADVSGPWRHRTAPRRLAQQRPRAGCRQSRQGEHLPHAVVREVPLSAARRRRTATARCSITRRCSTAAAWATAIRIRRRRCRWLSSAANASRAGATSSRRRRRRCRICC